MSPRTELNKRLVRAFVQALGSPDPVGPFRYVSPAYHLRGGTLTGDLDLPSAVAWRQAVLRAFPDLEVDLDVRRMVAEGDRVAVIARWRGTHRGPYRGILPTGRRVDLSIMGVFRLRNGRILEEVHLTDSLALVEQLQGSSRGTPGGPEAVHPGPPAEADRLPAHTERFFVPPEGMPGPWW